MGRDPRPIAVLLVGLTGSGKTTLARRLEAERGLERLSVDEEVFRRHGRYGVDYPHQTYPEKERPVIAGLQERLGQLLREGRDAVVDAGLWRRAEREHWRALAQAAGGRAVVVHLDVPPAELARRLEERNRREDANALRVTPGALQDFIARFEPPTSAEGAVDGTDPAAVLRMLAAMRGESREEIRGD